TQDMVIGMLQEITGAYVYLNSGPLFHIATFMTTLATFHFGGTNVFTRRVDAEELCRIIAVERCTGAFLLPPTIDQIAAVNRDGKEVPTGETGEIVARGPTVMTGYWNRDAENEERQAGGWHHTNDLGRREPDGSITFVGPRTRIVKSAAENIYPAEVEGCIQKHPAVKESAIIGVPDPKWTQSVKAIVVLEDGKTATAEEIIEHCRANIASYKKPKSVEF